MFTVYNEPTRLAETVNTDDAGRSWLLRHANDQLGPLLRMEPAAPTLQTGTYRQSAFQQGVTRFNGMASQRRTQSV